MKKKEPAQKISQETAGTKTKRQKPAKKKQDVQTLMKKRRKQLRHIQTMLQAAIRIANALSSQTVYRK